MNLCIDCIHHLKRNELDICDVVKSSVDGRAIAFCDIERDGNGLYAGCGKDGKKFERKITKIPKWKTWFAISI